MIKSKKWMVTMLTGAVLFTGMWNGNGLSTVHAMEGRDVGQQVVMMENSVQPRWSNIVTESTNFSLEGSTASVTAVLNCRNSSRITIVAKLQKKVSDGWYTIKSWTSSATGYACYLDQSYTVVARGTYRIASTFTADGETVHSTTPSKKY